jgi:hypothetical protein
MPVTYFIDTAKKLIHTVCAGPVCLEDVVDHFSALKNDPACVGSLNVLLDVSAVDSVPESNQLRVVGSQIAAIRPKVQFQLCAIIAERDAMYGMMMVFRVFAERWFREIRVFRKVTEAEAWLLHPERRVAG